MAKTSALHPSDFNKSMKPKIANENPKHNQTCKEKTDEETESTSDNSSEETLGDNGNQPVLAGGYPVIVARKYCIVLYNNCGDCQISSTPSRFGMNSRCCILLEGHSITA